MDQAANQSPHAEHAQDSAARAKNKKSKRLRALSTVFLFALIAVTMFVLFRDTSLSEVWSDVRSADPLWLALALGASLFSALLFGVALHIALRALYGRPISLIRSLGFGFIGQYYTAITPAGAAGQPMQLYYMLAYGVEVSFASLALLLVNASHQLVVLLIPAALFPLRAGLVLDNLGAFLWLFLLGALINIALILFLLFAVFSQSFAAKAVRWALGVLHKLRVVKNLEAAETRAETQIRLYRSGADVFLKHPRLLVAEFVTYALLLSSQFVIPYFIYRSFGLSGYDVVDFIVLQSILYLAVCFLPIPGSAGASESGFVTIFRVLFQSALIVPAMLLSRIASFYFILLLSGSISLAMQIVLSHRRRHAVPAPAVVEEPPQTE